MAWPDGNPQTERGSQDPGFGARSRERPCSPDVSPPHSPAGALLREAVAHARVEIGPEALHPDGVAVLREYAGRRKKAGNSLGVNE